MYQFKGTWSDNTLYSVGDVVIYTDNVVYHLQKAAPKGTPCTETRNWSKINKMLGQAVIMINQCLNMAIDNALTGKVANNLTTTASGKVLDARQGKALKGYVDELTTSVAGLAAFLPDTKTLRLASSTAESAKIFDITVDDDGELSATEYTPPSPEPEENNGGES